MVTRNQKPTTGTQKPKRKKHKHTIKESNQTTREETKKEEMKGEELEKQLGKK